MVKYQVENENGKKKPTAEQQVRNTIGENGGLISDRLYLRDFADTGRGVGTKMPIYTFEKGHRVLPEFILDTTNHNNNPMHSFNGS